MTLAQIQVSLGGGSNQSGWLQAGFGQSVQISGVNTSNWQQVRYELPDYPPGFSAPAGWSTDSSGVIYYQPASPATLPPAFNLPTLAANTWGCFAIRCRINGNPLARNADLTPNPAFNSNFTDESTILYIPSPNAAMSGLSAGMSNQADGLRYWTGPTMAALRALDAQLGAAAAGGYITLQGAVTKTMSLGTSLAFCDCAGVQTVFLPAAAPAGTLVEVRLQGNPATNAVTINGSSQNVEDPKSPGSFAATAVLNLAGQANQNFRWRMSPLTSTWVNA